MLCQIAAWSLALPAPVLHSDDVWPEYRGPNRDGIAPASAAVPLEWSEDKNVAWKTEIHGKGWSSPVVWGGQVWLTTATEDGRQLSVLALDLASGKVLHDDVLFEVAEPGKWRNSMNSYASPSPVIEDGRVYVHFGTYGNACLDTKTFETLWERRDINCDHMEGPGSSPILYGDLLIVNIDGGDVQYVTALDKKTGKTAWTTERSVDFEGLQPDLRKSYTTPIFIEAGGRTELVSTGAVATMAYDPRTGAELWKVEHGGWSASSRPVTTGDLVFINTGYMKAELWALRTGKLDDEDQRVAWKARRGIPNIPSPVLADGHIFMVSDGGIAQCLEAATGEDVWRERIEGEHAASPVLAAGRIYFFDREGKTTVLRAGTKFEVLARNQLDAGFMSSPAVVGDALILRTRTHVYRIAER